MKRSPVGASFYLWLVLSTIGLVGCGGTETGNPSGPPGGGDKNAAITLVNEICDKLTSCFGAEEEFTAEDCQEAVVNSDTLGASFGIEEEPLPGFEQVVDRVESSELSADEEALAACVEAIQSLACEDPGLLAVDVEQGFWNVEEMIPEGFCSQVFSGPGG
jgi:hypothetical protein